MIIWVDGSTKVEKEKRNGKAETPYINLSEALGLDGENKKYTITLLKQLESIDQGEI